MNSTYQLDDGNDDIFNLAYEQHLTSFENKNLIPKNLVYLVKNSKKEIDRNHLIAKIRLSETKKKCISKFKIEMADFFPSRVMAKLRD